MTGGIVSSSISFNLGSVSLQNIISSELDRIQISFRRNESLKLKSLVLIGLKKFSAKNNPREIVCLISIIEWPVILSSWKISCATRKISLLFCLGRRKIPPKKFLKVKECQIFSSCWLQYFRKIFPWLKFIIDNSIV